MRRGVECLLSEDEDEAMRIAGELDVLNSERREVLKRTRSRTR